MRASVSFAATYDVNVNLNNMCPNHLSMSYLGVYIARHMYRYDDEASTTITIRVTPRQKRGMVREVERRRAAGGVPEECKLSVLVREALERYYPAIFFRSSDEEVDNVLSLANIGE